MNTNLDSILADPTAEFPDLTTSTSADDFKKLTRSSVRAGSCVSNGEGSCAGCGAACASGASCAGGDGGTGGSDGCGDGGCGVGAGGSL